MHCRAISATGKCLCNAQGFRFTCGEAEWHQFQRQCSEKGLRWSREQDLFLSVTHRGRAWAEEGDLWFWCCLHCRALHLPQLSQSAGEHSLLIAFPALQGVRGHCSAGSEGDLPDTRHHTGPAFTREPVTHLCCSGCKSPLPKPLLDFLGHLRGDLVGLGE